MSSRVFRSSFEKLYCSVSFFSRLNRKPALSFVPMLILIIQGLGTWLHPFDNYLKQTVKLSCHVSVIVNWKLVTWRQLRDSPQCSRRIRRRTYVRNSLSRKFRRACWPRGGCSFQLTSHSLLKQEVKVTWLELLRKFANSLNVLGKNVRVIRKKLDV